MLETLAVSVTVVEGTVTAARLGISPLVANTGVASGSSVGALATSLSEGGGDDEEQSGDGSETHFEVVERWGVGVLDGFCQDYFPIERRKRY